MEGVSSSYSWFGPCCCETRLDLPAVGVCVSGRNKSTGMHSNKNKMPTPNDMYRLVSIVAEAMAGATS